MYIQLTNLRHEIIMSINLKKNIKPIFKIDFFLWNTDCESVIFFILIRTDSMQFILNWNFISILRFENMDDIKTNKMTQFHTISNE